MGGCLGYIGNIVGCDYSGEVFAGLRLAGDNFAYWRGGCPSTQRSSTATLDPSIHIGFIIKTNIEKLMPSLYSSTYKLEADIISSSIPGKGDKVDILILYLPLFY
jgi:hypothetical protein